MVEYKPLRMLASMPSLSSHANVFETCLQILARRGYELSFQWPEEDEESHGAFTAARDGFSFLADNPIELLGLVAVHDEVRPTRQEPYWWSAKTDGARVWDRLRDEATAREEARNAELAALRASDGPGWERVVRDAFEEGGDLRNAATFLGVTRVELRRMLEDPRFADLRGATR